MASQTLRIAKLEDYRQFDAVQLDTISELLGIYCLRQIVKDETPIAVTMTDAGRIISAVLLSPEA